MARDGPPPRLAAARRRDLADLAEAVVAERCGAGRIDPEAIAASAGLTLSFGRYGDGFDGMLEHRSGRFHVYCNVDRCGGRATTRARFTLAHELGHFYIDEHRNALAEGLARPHLSSCDHESQDVVELEADCFAAGLLMPAGRFLARASGAAAGMASVLRAAEALDASVTSAALRYAELGVSPCVVVKWGAGGRAWRCLSAEAREARLGRTINAAASVAAGSPTARALAGEPPPATGFFEAGTTVAAWFPGVPHGGRKNALLVEQAFPLGRFGVLTMLVPCDGESPWAC